jgi:hypothetical protein
MWSAFLVLGTLYVVIRNLGSSAAGNALVLLVGAHLLAIGSGGNVQPLMVAMLVGSLERRWLGPASIAVCASLKLAPGLLVAVYVGRRQWGRVLTTLGLTLVLISTYATVDLKHYPRALPGSLSLAEVHTGLWLLATITMFVVAFSVANRRSPFAWLAAVLAVLVGSPRLGDIETTYLLAVPPNSNRDARGRRTP